MTTKNSKKKWAKYVAFAATGVLPLCSIYFLSFLKKCFIKNKDKMEKIFFKKPSKIQVKTWKIILQQDFL